MTTRADDPADIEPRATKGAAFDRRSAEIEAERPGVVVARDTQQLSARLRALHENAPWPIGFSRDGINAGANAAYVKLFGYDSEAEVVGTPLLGQIAPSARADIARRLEARERGEPTAAEYETVGVRKDGSEFPFLVRLTRVELDEGYVTAVFIEDITERKRAEESLRQSEERYRLIFESSGTANAIFDTQCRLVLQNSLSVARLGMSEAEAHGKSAREIFGPAAGPVVEERMRRVSSSTTAEAFETEFDLPGGKRWFRTTYLPLVDAARRARGVQVISQDITDRKQAEQALTESETKYRSLVEGSLEGIGISKGDRVVYANPALLELLGWDSLEECREVRLIDHVAPGSRDLIRDRQARRARGEALPSRYEYQLLRNDGSVRDIEIWSTQIDVGGEAHTQSTFRDVTERKRADLERARLEAQLHHAQKMEAIGTLAGGVAHDFNNILAGIMGGLSLLRLELDEASDSHRGDIDDMMAFVQRGSDLAKQLLGFGRRGKYDARPLDLAAVASKTAIMFGRTRRDVTVHLDFERGLWAVLMDHAQLEQVLLNLFLNAGQAMPAGGNLLVRAENATLGEAAALPHAAAPGAFVKLIVSDTGVGMDAATKARAFEPFFTTKALGHGTGLGLASVYGIIKNHGGVITVDSELARGTAFTIFLPAATAPIVQQAAPPVAPRRGHGTILVVDDEEKLLKLCARLLRAMGYDALTALGGREAMDLLRAHGDRVSLVILDLTMPEMSGAETYDALRALAPDLKVLIASGFTVDGQAQALLERGCNGFIQKPFDLAALSAKLAAIL